jgi:hypothetical protein
VAYGGADTAPIATALARQEGQAALPSAAAAASPASSTSITAVAAASTAGMGGPAGSAAAADAAAALSGARPAPSGPVAVCESAIVAVRYLGFHRVWQASDGILLCRTQALSYRCCTQPST